MESIGILEELEELWYDPRDYDKKYIMIEAEPIHMQISTKDISDAFLICTSRLIEKEEEDEKNTIKEDENKKKESQAQSLNNMTVEQLFNIIGNIDVNGLIDDKGDKSDKGDKTDKSDKSGKVDSKSKEKHNSNNCSECGAINSMIEDTSKGYNVCKECGIVSDTLIDTEFKAYDEKGEPISKNTNNAYFEKSSLGTTISGGSAFLRKIHKWNSMDYKDRTFKNAMDLISSSCQKNGIKKIIFDDAIFMWKKISESKYKKGPNKGKSIIIRGDNRLGIMAACVFYACIFRNAARSNKEIAKIFGLESRYVSDGCKTFYSLMNENFKLYNFHQSKPADYIPRHCDFLKIRTKNYVDETINISKNIKKIGIANDHTSSSVAAGSILLLIQKYKMKITKKQLAKSFGISEVTVSKIVKKLMPYKDLLMNDKACDYIEKRLKTEFDEV